MLFAGIAILIDETTETLAPVFENFVLLHGKAPASFMSGYGDEVAAVIDQLRIN